MNNSALEEDDQEDHESLEFLHNALFVLQEKAKKTELDHRWLPRSKRRRFRHAEALHCIQRDCTGIPGDLSTPIFAGREFDTMFRISRSRFQRLLEDVGNFNDPFYLDTKDCFGHEVASLEAR